MSSLAVVRDGRSCTDPRVLPARPQLLAAGTCVGEDLEVPWFVYLARCADDTLYCGITNDLAARLVAHNAGKGARYTRSRTPIAMLVVRRCATKSRALRLEHRVKQLSRVQKEQLIATPALFTRLARQLSTRPGSAAVTS